MAIYMAELKKRNVKCLWNTKIIMSFLAYFNIALCSFTLLFVQCSSQSPDAFHLLQFRQSLPQTSQYLLPWNQSGSLFAHCQWPGVSCYSNTTDPRVKSLNLTGFRIPAILENSILHLCTLSDLITLDLGGNNFTGTIPPLLGNCSKLTTIFIHDNRFYGPIPSNLFRSTLLQLNLGFNQLSGNIPIEIANCINLEYLAMHNNLLTGQIPNELFSLPKLTYISLNTNSLSGRLPDLPSSCLLSELRIHENQFQGSLPLSLNNCHNLTILYATDTNLGGVIPSNIFRNMSKLERIYLDGNEFEGPIPESIWGLGNLQRLVLASNKFNGSIPEQIFGLSDQLTYLDLSGNELSGQIPASVGQLRKLERLYLYRNMFNGFIPPEIGNCSSLIRLRLDENHIRGVLPHEICELLNLKDLFTPNNQIGGTIPQCIGRLTSLEQLALYNNSLTGGIPSGIINLKNLTFLSLARNDFSGEVPSELGTNNVPGLERVDLTGNRLSGEIPSGLCSGNFLRVLTVGGNLFNGSFPTELAKCKSLYRVILSNNRLKGSLIDLENSTSISHLNLRGNFFQGHIPAAFGFWRNLSMIDLSGNNFEGPIPKEFGNLENLEELNISSNRLTAGIPPELANCLRIAIIDVSKNNLSGGIPWQLMSSLSLQIVLLQENRLTGEIPDSFSRGQSIRELQVGHNMLEGQIPCSLSRVGEFSTILNLSTNHFSGNIPRCLGNFDMLEILDISSNNFSGEIPMDVDNMRSLSYLNISYNQLVGHIPPGWASILENHPGSSSGNPELHISNCNCEPDRDSNKRVVLIVIPLLVTFFLASLCVLVIRIRRSRTLPPDEPILPISEELPEDLTFKDIIRATEDWSEKYVIGRGRHGTVYRVKSVKSEKQWAVKKVDLSETEFSIEQRCFTMVKHRNILRMRGYGVRNGCGVILTDYMPKGTLHDLLHLNISQTTLDWKTRHQIALGVAHGLLYLHHDCVPQVLHRDIKSDNILLDEAFEPKIGDFGSAKLDESTTNSLIVGTLGYIAPENAYSANLTSKSDVYSYGVILLELLFRKLPVDPDFDEGSDIVSWVRKISRYQNNNFFYLLDKEMQYWDEQDQRKALMMMDIALQCTEIVPHDRPSMKDVIFFLDKLELSKELE